MQELPGRTSAPQRTGVILAVKWVNTHRYKNRSKIVQLHQGVAGMTGDTAGLCLRRRANIQWMAQAAAANKTNPALHTLIFGAIAGRHPQPVIAFCALAVACFSG